MVALTQFDVGIRIEWEISYGKVVGYKWSSFVFKTVICIQIGKSFK